MGSAKRPVRQQAAVFPSERNSLRHALIDDFHANLGEAIDVRFPRTKIATFDRVVEQPEHAVAVVLVIFRRVNTTLGSDAVRTPRTILETEAFDAISKFGRESRCRGSRQSTSDHQNIKLSFVVWTDQFGLIPVFSPFRLQRTGRNLGTEGRVHNLT